MRDSSEQLPRARNWREIPQDLKPRAMSPTGRRRYLLSVVKFVGGFLIVGLLSWGVVDLVSTLENNPRQLARATQSSPVRDITLVSDGVLGKEWLSRVLSIPKTASLMELDLTSLQAKLMNCGQVRNAVLTKQFPSTLAVLLSERSPIARIMIEEATGLQTQLFVARDGIVYKGEGYDVAFSDSLPWLSGVRLSRNAGVIQPIEGMNVVAELLAKAKYEAEHLYPLFQIINLARLKSDGAIEVSSPECDTIVFSANDDFFQQLAMLDSIHESEHPTRDRPLARVDLSLGRDVPIAYRPAVAKQTPGSAPARKAAGGTPQQAAPAKRELSPALFNLQRNTSNREL